MPEKIQYPLLRRENIPAYLAVMAICVAVSLVSATTLKVVLAPTLGWPQAVVWALFSTMAGMAIMFVASALNLRKLRAGFDRLSRGDADPGIPQVWCPVLTMATEAAVTLQHSLKERDAGPNPIAR